MCKGLCEEFYMLAFVAIFFFFAIYAILLLFFRYPVRKLLPSH